MFTRKQSKLIFLLQFTLLLSLLLISACTIESSSTTLPNPTATPKLLTTEVSTALKSPHIFLDTGEIATNFQSEKVAAVSAGMNTPYWEILPEYTRVTLQGYPISSHCMQPQIFIYPLEALEKVNGDAFQRVASLQFLLRSPQEIETMPFLPLINAKQMMHAHTQYLDLQNSQGVRYLAWYSQGIVPVNNHELIYTYQGLTSDGKYYVAAVLPVNHPSLPTDTTVTGIEPLEFTNDYAAYLINVAANLNPQATKTFTPDLAQLDAMMVSLEIK